MADILNFDRAGWLMFNLAVGAIIEFQNKSIFLEIAENVLLAHFAKDKLKISTSFDMKYNDENKAWEYGLYFRGINQKGQLDMSKYDFPNLNNLLDDDLLPALIDEEVISDKAFLNEDSTDGYYIQSSNPDDIVRLNIILLDVLQYKGGRLMIDQAKKQKFLEAGPLALPAMDDYLAAWQRKQPARGSGKLIEFRKPPSLDISQ